MAARERLAAEGVSARVVSMPCTRRFDAQPADWRAAVLPVGIPRLAVEAARSDGWWKYVTGPDCSARGAVIGIDRFGESAPAGELAAFFGLTPDRVAEAAMRLIRG
jgi:transketolase